MEKWMYIYICIILYIYIHSRCAETECESIRRPLSQIWRPSKNPADAASQICFQGFSWRTICGPNMYCKPSHEALKTSSLKSTSQIWRPSKNPAGAGSQVLFSRVYLEVNMRPKLCNPSHEAHQRSSFKTYLPNLTVFKKPADAGSQVSFSRISPN